MLEIAKQTLEHLLTEARATHPDECCGILLGSAGTITAIAPAANVHPTPATHFEIDPATLIDAHRAARNGGPAVLGHYHSHPNGRVGPSPTDRAMAAGDGSVWAIIAAGAVTFWSDEDNGIIALPYRPVSG